MPVGVVTLELIVEVEPGVRMSVTSTIFGLAVPPVGVIVILPVLTPRLRPDGSTLTFILDGAIPVPRSSCIEG